MKQSRSSQFLFNTSEKVIPANAGTRLTSRDPRVKRLCHNVIFRHCEKQSDEAIQCKHLKSLDRHVGFQPPRDDKVYYDTVSKPEDDMRGQDDMRGIAFFRRFLFLILILVLVGGCTSGKVDSLLKRAEELKGTRQFEEAVNVYEIITTKYPEDKKVKIAYLKMGDLYLYTLSDSKKAMSVYAKILEKWPLEDEAREASLRRAEILKMDNNSRGAVNEYERVIKHFPEHEDRAKIRLALAEEYLNLNDPYQASVELEDIVKEGSTVGEVHYKALFVLGESRFLMGLFDKALESFSEMIEKCPDCPYVIDAKLRKVESLFRLNKSDEGQKLGEELLKNNPDSEIVKTRLEGLLRREEKTEKPDIQTFKQLDIIKVGKTVASFRVEVADTVEKRAQGLMYRKDLPEEYGMLFMFDSDTRDPFWMKNTYVSLDIVFIDSNKKICSIAKNTEPMSQSGIYPKRSYRYTLELLAGTAAKFNLKEGDSVVWK